MWKNVTFKNVLVLYPLKMRSQGLDFCLICKNKSVGVVLCPFLSEFVHLNSFKTCTFPVCWSCTETHLLLVHCRAGRHLPLLVWDVVVLRVVWAGYLDRVTVPADDLAVVALWKYWMCNELSFLSTHSSLIQITHYVLLAEGIFIFQAFWLLTSFCETTGKEKV